MLIYANSHATPAPTFEFGVMSSAGGQLVGQGTTTARAASGASINTSTYLFQTPHGIAASSNTNGNNYGNSFAAPGANAGFTAGYQGGSSAQGILPIYPINKE